MSTLQARGQTEWRSGPVRPRARYAILAVGSQPGQITTVEYRRSRLVAEARLRRWQKGLNYVLGYDGPVTMMLKDRWVA